MPGYKVNNTKRKITSPEKQLEILKKSKTTAAFLNMEQTNEYLRQIVENNSKIILDNQEIVQQLKLQNENHERHFKLLNVKLHSLDSRINYLDTDICSRSVRIVGACVDKEETPATLVKLVKKMCSTLKVQFQERDIDDIFRCGKDKKAIKVEFISKLKRREFVAAARGKELTGMDVGLESNDRLLVFDFLSPHNALLYRETKELKRNGIVKFAWIKNGRVLVKEKEGDKALLVQRIEDLAKFKNN